MFQALKLNRPNFVQLLIDNYFDIVEFLTDDRHLELYKNVSDFNQVPFINYLKQKWNLDIKNIDYETNNFISKFFEQFSDIQYGLFLSLLGKITVCIINTKNTRPPEIIHLFIWSIFYDRSEISKIFLAKIKDEVIT